MIKFHANHVSASVAGDYYQITFEENSEDLDRAYLVIQRQFEDPGDETCYIETHDPEYCGHFHPHRAELTAEALLIELDRPIANLISVTFSMEPREFQAVLRVMKVISGESEPEPE